MQPRMLLALAGPGLLLAAAPALAQEIGDEAPAAEIVAGGGTGRPVSLQLEVAGDNRLRGLSWSAGKPAASVRARAGIGDGLELGASAALLRGSLRHGGADLGMQLSGGWAREIGNGWQLGLTARGYLFGGRAALNYAEVEAEASYRLGPALMRAGAAYAPRQTAIGGDNLSLSAGVDIGVPTTPLTIYGGVGHSLGATSDAVRAARLRPDGAYWNWWLGAEWVRGRAALGASWTDTSIADGAVVPGRYSDPHVGSRLTGYLRIDL